MLPNLDVPHILFTNPIDEQNAERKGQKHADKPNNYVG